jgi:MFS family permease
MTNLNESFNGVLVEEKFKFHQIALLTIMTTFFSEVLQTFIIPCTIYLPQIYKSFFSEFSYGVYFLGSITGLFFGLVYTKKIGYKSTYLLGIKIALSATLVVALLTYVLPHHIISDYVFYWLYPYRMILGFGTALTYGINAVLVVQVFAEPIDAKVLGVKFKYTSTKLFSWCYIILLLEMTLNPFIAYHLFNRCSWHSAANYLSIMSLFWLFFAANAIPKDKITMNKNENVRSHLKHFINDSKFIRLSTCAGMMTGIAIVISVELPFFVTNFFHRSTMQYSSANMLLIIVSALGAFVAGFGFVRKSRLKIAQVILVAMACFSIVYYFLPQSYYLYILYLGLVYMCVGFCGPVLNDLIMVNVDSGYQVTASMLLNGFFLLCMISFNFLDAAVLHTIRDTQAVVLICLIFTFIIISRSQLKGKNNTN